MYPQTVSTSQWKDKFDVLWSNFPEKRQEIYDRLLGDINLSCEKNAFILIIFSVNRDTNRMDFVPKFHIREFSYLFEPTRMTF